MIQSNLLIAPLNWGLGHATRCIPLINSLLNRKENINIFIASDGRALALLKKEFGHLLHFLELPSYDIVYPKTGNMSAAMARQTPKLLRAIYREYIATQKIVEQFNISGIISDNRYGCFSPRSYSVFITHQFFLQMPPALRFLSPLINGINGSLIRRFDACWIPDYAHPSNNLSADLSHSTKPHMANVQYISPLSRLNHLSHNKGNMSLFMDKVYSIVVILSGPEPQRSIFDEKITQQLLTQSAPSLIVQGITEKQSFARLAPHLDVVSYLTSAEIANIMSGADYIITRAGYSTLMDLCALGKKAVLVPTPGQTEQEYLAQELCRKGLFYSVSQDKFQLTEALAAIHLFSGISNWKVNDYEAYLTDFLDKSRTFR